MKQPTHPVPSGDRRMARLLMAALARAGHRVELASRLRSYDGAGDPARQAAIATRARGIAARLLRRYRARPPAQRPAAWFTYHLYYKAPDWLGPAVADALAIPYLVAEASHAPKRAGGAWAPGHAAAADAIARAAAIFTLNPVDAECLAPLAGAGRVVRLPPFLDAVGPAPPPRAAARAALAGRFGLDAGRTWLLAAAMMRAGDKLASYRLLGQALRRLSDLDWQLLVVGDGPARDDVEAALAGLGVRYAGAQAEQDLAAFYAAADLCVWPAVNEAYGMVLLEAQAAGLPVVAGIAGGVAAIVADGATGLLTPAGDEAAFAEALRRLILDPARRAAMGAAARAKAAREHDIATAAAILDAELRRACAAAKDRSCRSSP
ncbi:MAG: glycosyltransferase family 4 protein [Dongiaceae bacterium]